MFFIRDGKKFVDLNHALKPNPITGVQVRPCLAAAPFTGYASQLKLTLTLALQEGWRILDFLTHHPESTHVVRLCCTGIQAFCKPAAQARQLTERHLELEL